MKIVCVGVGVGVSVCCGGGGGGALPNHQSFMEAISVRVATQPKDAQSRTQP